MDPNTPGWGAPPPQPSPWYPPQEAPPPLPPTTVNRVPAAPDGRVVTWAPEPGPAERRGGMGPAGWGILAGGVVGVLVVALAAILLTVGLSDDDASDTASAEREIPGAAQTTAADDGAPDGDPGAASGTTGARPSGATPRPSATTPRPSATTPQPSAASGDLGLSVPISRPVCDGTWVVFLGAATDPATYVSEMARLLATRPDAQYTVTEGGCTSMRQRSEEGTLIYTAYLGPFATQADACAVRGQVGGGAYVKRMDNVTPASQLWQC